MPVGPGTNPAGNYILPNFNTLDATSYKAAIDADFAAGYRVAGAFAPMYWPAQFGTAMNMMLAPGGFYNGGGGTTELGAITTGNFTSASTSVTSVNNLGVGVQIGMVVLAYTFATVSLGSVTATSGNATLTGVSSTAGVYVGMSLYDNSGRIPAGATVVSFVTNTSITMSANALSSGATTAGCYGMQPVTAINTIVTAVSGATVTISPAAIASATGATVIFAQPIGTVQSGTITNGSSNVTGLTSTRGIFAGMGVSGTGISGGTTVSSVTGASTLTLSANASSSTTTSLTFSVPPPASNSRCDYVSLDPATGLPTWTPGIPSATPAVLATPTANLPCAVITTTSATTAINGTNLSDYRFLDHLGLSAYFVKGSAGLMSGTVRHNQNINDNPGLGNTQIGGAFQANGQGATWFLSRQAPLGGTCLNINNNSLGPASSPAECITFCFSGSAIGNITVTASIVAFNTTSDYRAKIVKGAFDQVWGSSWSALCEIPIYGGVYKNDATMTVQPFYLAHEVQKWAPELVTGKKDGMKLKPRKWWQFWKQEWEPDYQKVNATGWAPRFIEAFREIKEALGQRDLEIMELRCKFAELQERLDNLTGESR